MKCAFLSPFHVHAQARPCGTVNLGRLILALMVALLSGSTGMLQAAEILKVGDTFGPFAAKDQHGVDFKFAPGIRYMLFTFDMGTGKKANKVLAEKGTNYLSNHKAVYVSNVYGMPAIGRFFAMPKMRRYPHRIVLADAEGLLSSYPQKPDHVTVMQLNPNATIDKISFWDPEKEGLDAYIKADSPASDQ